MQGGEENRRPIRARSSALAQRAAARLVAADISPNQISVASVFFAAAGTLCLLYVPAPFGPIFCAIGIQGRLICNLLDGMVAVEGGRKSALGNLYNEFPDRVADSMLIVALGYAADFPWLGWFGALAAALTAYVRVFGGSLGMTQDFRGPMAKQHRMAVMTIACLAGAVESQISQTNYALLAAAILILAGSLATCATRTLAIASGLRR